VQPYTISCPYTAERRRTLPYTTVLANSKERAALHQAAEDEALLGVELEKIPYTKCELRHQTNQALQFQFSKTATSSTLCGLILHFSHTAEYSMTEADIARTESQNLRNEIQKVLPSKVDMRQRGRGNVAGVMAREGILQGMKECDEKDAEKQANHAAKAAAKAAEPLVTPYTKKWPVQYEHDGAPSTIPRYRQSVISITSDALSIDWHSLPRPTASRCGLSATPTQTQHPPYSDNTAKVRRDLLKSQKKYTKNKYCKYNEIEQCSKGKHILRRGFERKYYSIPIDV